MMMQVLYHHECRKGSISNNYTADNKRDNLIASLGRKDDLISYGYPEEKMMDSLCISAIEYLARNVFGEKLYEKAATIIDSTHGIPRDMSKKQKIALWLWRKDNRLFYMLCKVSGRLHN